MENKIRNVFTLDRLNYLIVQEATYRSGLQYSSSLPPDAYTGLLANSNYRTLLYLQLKQSYDKHQRDLSFTLPEPAGRIPVQYCNPCSVPNLNPKGFG